MWRTQRVRRLMGWFEQPPKPSGPTEARSTCSGGLVGLRCKLMQISEPTPTLSPQEGSREDSKLCYSKKQTGDSNHWAQWLTRVVQEGGRTNEEWGRLGNASRRCHQGKGMKAPGTGPCSPLLPGWVQPRLQGSRAPQDTPNPSSPWGLSPL
jgi:hypothetical protein